MKYKELLENFGEEQNEKLRSGNLKEDDVAMNKIKARMDALRKITEDLGQVCEHRKLAEE